MSDKLKESLSAVVDGEADEFELRRVLDEVGKDPALEGLWLRYHLIGAQVRRELIPANPGLADRIWEAVTEVDGATAAADAAVPPSAAQIAPARSWRRVGGIAVAASVAVAVMLGVQNLPLFGGAEDLPLQALNIEGPVLQVEPEVSASDVQRANAYILHHVQQRAMNAPGVVSFVKVATYEDASTAP